MAANVPCAVSWLESFHSKQPTHVAKCEVTHVFQAVKILVPLATCFAAKGLFLFHAQCAGIGSTCLGIDDRKCSISVFVQLLRLMTMRLVIPVIRNVSRGSMLVNLVCLLEAVLVLIRLLTANDGALERFMLFGHHHALQALHQGLVLHRIVQLGLCETQLSQLCLEGPIRG